MSAAMPGVSELYGPGDQARAFLNILEDFTDEKGRLESTHRAVLNILEDASAERQQLQDVQRAVLNIFEDLAVEKARLEDARREVVRSELAARQSLKEKEVLLQEVHHRVKNNLQVISSLISMQARQLGEGPSRDALEECQTRVQAIGLIHEKLYQSQDYARVPFSEYARSLAANVFHATGVSPAAISLKLAVEEVALSVDKAIPCGLILNELITNALKHGFPDGRTGTIRVEICRVSGGRLRLAVSDDGVGLPPSLNVATSTTLGLHLVRMLAKQLAAELEVDTDKGTSFRVSIPGEDFL
jgi:two-component system, sensor histidine kinase PdtaS